MAPRTTPMIGAARARYRAGVPAGSGRCRPALHPSISQLRMAFRSVVGLPPSLRLGSLIAALAARLTRTWFASGLAFRSGRALRTGPSRPRCSPAAIGCFGPLSLALVMGAGCVTALDPGRRPCGSLHGPSGATSEPARPTSGNESATSWARRPLGDSPSEGHLLSGKVVDSAGVPVPGAFVWASQMVPAEQAEWSTSRRELRPPHTAVADPNGRFSLGPIRPDARGAVHAEHPQFVGGVSGYSAGKEHGLNVVVTLWRAGWACVRVLGSDHRSVEGAQVEAEASLPEGLEHHVEHGHLLLDSVVTEKWRLSAPKATDSDGDARIGPLLPGRYQVRARLGERVHSRAVVVQVAEGAEVPVVVELARAVALRGQVIDLENRPVADLGICAWREGELFGVYGRSDREGRFALQDVAEGEYMIAVLGDRWELVPPRVVVRTSADAQLRVRRVAERR